MPHLATRTTTQPQGFPPLLAKSNHGKRTGAEQVEHRIENVIRDIEAARLDAVTRGKPRLARKFDMQRAGAVLALEAVAELLRNYGGCE